MMRAIRPFFKLCFRIIYETQRWRFRQLIYKGKISDFYTRRYEGSTLPNTFLNEHKGKLYANTFNFQGLVFIVELDRSKLPWAGGKFPVRFVPLLKYLTSQSVPLIGDLQEGHSVIMKKDGKSTADRWYYRQVALSFISLASSAVKRLSGIERLSRIG
jgi:hypothetical protein